MTYRFDEELGSMVLMEDPMYTRKDLRNKEAAEWLDKKDKELGLSQFGEYLISDYVEFANLKFSVGEA